MTRLRIALAPLDPHPTDISANAAAIRAARAMAAAGGADLLVTPAASLGGEAEAWDRPDCRATFEAALAALAADTADGGPGLVVGGPWLDGPHLREAAFLLDAGRVLARRARHVVRAGGPLAPGPVPGPVVFRGIRLGLMAGTDWRAAAVPETLAETGAELLLGTGAGPFAPVEPERRIDEAVARVVETGLPLAVLGRLGGGEGPVFDGDGFVLNPSRALAVRRPLFTAGLTLTDWAASDEGWTCAAQPLPPPMPAPDQLWQALMAGLAGHVARHGFAGVLLDLDAPHAALALACASQALGPGRVRAVALPAAGTPRPPPGEVVPLLPALDAFRQMLGVAPEDAVRAASLAVLARASNSLLLDARDRTDWALGRDAPPGFALLRDLWAEEARELARQQGLAPAPPPDAPAPLLRAFLEDGLVPATLPAHGFDPVTIDRVWRSLDWRGYKRRQAPPGVTIGRHALSLFGLN